MKKNQLIAVITGDIVGSSELDPAIWMKWLKMGLCDFGEEYSNWEIYRGDSFQLELSAEDALEAVIVIKAYIKRIRSIDIRMSIGIGTKDFHSKKVTSSNGTAFVNSGQSFENLKKQKLAIKSDVEEFDEQINIMLDLASLTMDEWAPISSMIFLTALKNPELNQRELAQILDNSQSGISEGLKRTGYDEIKKMISFYRKKVQETWLN